MKTQVKLLAAALAVAVAGSAGATGITLTATGATTSNGDPGFGISYGAGAKTGVSDPALFNASNAYFSNSIALGMSSQALSKGSVALGGQAISKGWDNTAIGAVSEAQGLRNSAIGTYATVVTDAAWDPNSRGVQGQVQNSTALGTNSSVVTKDVIAGKAVFSDEVITKDWGVLSVGKSADAVTRLKAASGKDVVAKNYTAPAFKRRVINVAGGILDSDAVNVLQLKAVNTQLGARIDANKAQIDQNTAQIATNTAGIAANATRIEEVNIDLGNRIDSNSARIDQLGQANAQLNQRLEATNQRINDVERTATDGAALALATAGLVQPPEGKSGVVVGTGFYRNSSAIAVGYGYTSSSWGVKAAASAAGRGNFGGSVSAGYFW